MSPRQQDRVNALTSLRFFAASYVLVFHSGGPTLSISGRLPAPLENFLANGYLGVTFFFVLSGFILTYVYYGKLTTSDALSRYSVARFARVYPVYLLALLLMIPFVSSPFSVQSLPQFFLLQSWVPLRYFDGVWITNSNGPAWSLSVELFFYVIFPWLVRGAFALHTRSVVTIALVFCIIMIVLRLPSISNEHHVLYDGLRYVPLPLLRAPEFIYGALLGVLYRRGAIPRNALALYIVLGLSFAVLCSSKSPWVAPLATVLFGGVIALVPTSLDEGLPARMLNSKTLVLLGGASYGIYLLQSPVHSWMLWLFGEHYELTARLVFMPTLVIFSIVVFLFWEEKMREQLRRLSSRRVSLA